MSRVAQSRSELLRVTQSSEKKNGGQTDRQKDRPTDRRTDTPSYRDARTHLIKGESHERKITHIYVLNAGALSDEAPSPMPAEDYKATNTKNSVDRIIVEQQFVFVF